MTTRQEEKRLYEIGKGIAGAFTDKFPLSQHEALLHEVCHAVALGIQWNEDAPARISTRFENINAKSELMGLLYEAQCFAVERHACRMLRWHRRIPLGKVESDVWENGRSGRCMPKKAFLLMIRRFMREKETQHLAVKAAGTMLRMARRPA